jgi:glycosyltransferase involved in cell wall biosynthesis
MLVFQSDTTSPQWDYILASLNARGIPITLFTNQKLQKEKLQDSLAGIKIRKAIPTPQSFGDWLFFTLLTPLVVLYCCVRLVIRKIAKEKILVLPNLTEQLLVTPWARLLGYRVYWVHHTFYPQSFSINIYKLFLRAYSRLASTVVDSQALHDELTQIYKVPTEHITLIRHGVDIEHVQNQTSIYESMVEKEYQVKNEALFIIGFIGELVPENGIETLLKSVEFFKELIPHFQIIIVGDGAHKKSLLWLVKMLHLDQNIRFVGKQDHLLRWYNYFNIFVYPRTASTEFSLEVAQAQAAGIPTVCYTTPGIGEIVDNQGGYVLETRGAEAIADAIFTLYNDPDLRTRFSNQAKQRMKKYYSLDTIIQEYSSLFEQ